jgi:hypothetical protein
LRIGLSIEKWPCWKESCPNSSPKQGMFSECPVDDGQRTGTGTMCKCPAVACHVWVESAMGSRQAWEQTQGQSWHSSDGRGERVSAWRPWGLRFRGPRLSGASHWAVRFAHLASLLGVTEVGCLQGMVAVNLQVEQCRRLRCFLLEVPPALWY